MTTFSAFPILLVDDNEHLAQILSLAAQETFPEASIHAVRSYDHAVSYLDEKIGLAPRLILLDIDLQVGPDGLYLLEQLRQHPQWHPIPVVVLTNIDDENAVADSYQGGANYFTNKPVSYAGWQDYMQQLRDYWLLLATTPTIWLEPKPRPTK